MSLLKPLDVARRLQISPSMAYRLIARGEIESYRIGRRCVRVSEEALSRYLQAKEEETPSTLPARRHRHF